MGNLRNRLRNIELKFTQNNIIEIPAYKNINDLSENEVNELYSKIQNQLGFIQFPDLDNMNETQIETLFKKINN